LQVQYLFGNHKGRDFVCGDIHGCFDLLEERMAEVRFNPKKDRLFSVGDMIDRGTNSAKALSYIGQKWFYCIRGNHEQMFLDWIMTDKPMQIYNAFHLHIQNGGEWVADFLGVSLRQLGVDIENGEDINKLYPKLRLWIDALKNLPYAIEIKTAHKTTGLVHAEIPQEIPWASLEAESHKNNIANSLLFSRKYINGRKFKQYQIKGIDEIFCGHTIVDRITRTHNIYYIDTGAYMTENLALIEFNH